MKRALFSAIGVLLSCAICLAATLPLGSGSVFPVGPSASSSGTVPSLPSAIYNDGASQPIGNSVYGLNQFYDSGTDTYWFSWEGYQSVQGFNQRLEEFATWNHTTNTWSGNYVVNTLTLTNDPHGIPVPAADSSGRVYAACCSHNSPVLINQIGTLSGGAFKTPSVLLPAFGTAVTFPNLFSVGTNTLYMFYNTTGTGTGGQETIAVAKGTTSATGIAWGAPQAIFDAANDWLPIGQGQVNSTSIPIVFTHALTDGGPGLGLYYAVYNTANGTVCNFSGGHCDAVGAQPVGLASLNTNYRIYTGTDLYFPGFALDSNGNPHVAIVDASSSPQIIVALDGAAGSFTTTTIYTYTVPAGGLANDSNGVGVIARGLNVDVCFSDAAAQNDNSTAGNIRCATYNGTSWASSVLVQAMTGGIGLDVPAAIPNGTANARAIWTQVTSDNITISGALQGYVKSDTGFLQRPSGYGLLPGTETTAFDPANTTTHITLSSAFGISNLTATATASSTNGYQARETVSHSTGKWYFEATKTNATAGAALWGLGLANASFNTTNDSAFLGQNNNSIGWYGNGKVYQNNVNTHTIGTITSNAVPVWVGVAVDLDNKKIWICVGSSITCTWNNDVIANQNPATNTGGYDISAITGAVYPAIELDANTLSGYFNNCQFPPNYGPPAGFACWNYLLKRDLDPTANDNTPAYMNKVA